MIGYIEGGVCAARGFRAGGVHCGIRNGKKSKKDLALIVSDVMCSAAAVYTTNKVKGAPIAVTREHLKDGRARAVICNSGNANTCAPGGRQLAEDVCALTAEHAGLRPEDVIVCSTGVIGEKMDMAPFERGIGPVMDSLSYEGGRMAAEAMMTTDTVPKECAVEFTAGGVKCTVGAAAKGSGMICPDMATMLSFITTDAAISPQMLSKALREDVKDSYNQLSVDRDTSTNDTVAIMANGMAGNREISCEGEDYDAFCSALAHVTRDLARQLAKDGEGAGKMIQCRVEGAPDKETARIVSKSVISSDLLKSAMFGEDANWGRVLCAVGYAPAEFDAGVIDVEMSSDRGSVTVCRGSELYPHSEEEASRVLSSDEIIIKVDMNQGGSSADAWGCDLTYDYVRINGDYRS